MAEAYKVYLPMPYNRQCWDLLSATLDQPQEMTDVIKEITYKKN